MKIKYLFILVVMYCVYSFTLNHSSYTGKPTAGSLQPQAVIGLNLGNEAPDLELRNPYGKAIKLSSLRGKMVLVDFWASWCGPCRYENPTVVKAYTLYKDKKFKTAQGFTIYSVSLDASSEPWKKAIEKDGLVWENHVSDLMGWNSMAAMRYGVNSIPTNFLLNEKGIIIQKDLRGEQLLNALEKLTKTQ